MGWAFTAPRASSGFEIQHVWPKILLFKSSWYTRGSGKQGSNLSCVGVEGMALQVKNKGDMVERSSSRVVVSGRIWGKAGGHETLHEGVKGQYISTLICWVLNIFYIHAENTQHRLHLFYNRSIWCKMNLFTLLMVHTYVLHAIRECIHLKG